MNHLKTNMKTENSKTFSTAAFTLIELLVVISIISVLAGLIIGGLGAAKKKQNRDTARAELEQIKAAIDSYHDKYGSYPPGNQNNVAVNYDPLSLSQLYYELSGVTHNVAAQTYTTLDGATTISEANYTTAFGVAGIVNVSKGGGEDAVPAKNFLTGLKAKQINNYVSNGIVPNTTVLITSVGGPDDNYKPLGVSALNPFRYNPGYKSVSPTNNPSSYDLWVDLVIGGKTNRINNWNAK